MADTTKTNAMIEVAQFLVSVPSPEQIIAFHPSQAATARVYELIEAERDHALSPDERYELDMCTTLEYLMDMIKVEAHRKLAQ